MKNQTFEEYLADIHIKIHPEILDDDLPDHFDNWLGELSGEDYMEWAELYGKEQYLAGQQFALNQLK